MGGSAHGDVESARLLLVLQLLRHALVGLVRVGVRVRVRIRVGLRVGVGVGVGVRVGVELRVGVGVGVRGAVLGAGGTWSLNCAASDRAWAASASSCLLAWLE